MKIKTRVLVALWFFQVVNYLDRVVISFAGPSIMKSLAIGPGAFGIMLSSFSLGYLVGQLPGGMIADRWGSKSLLVVGPLFWALFTGVTGLVASIVGFAVVRLCFGLSEGVSNAPCFKVIGDNFTSKERPRAGGIWLTAMPIAPALTAPLMSLLLARFSWRNMFMLLAIPALVAALLNYFALPAQKVSATPLSSSLVEDSMPVSVMVRNASIWTLSISYLCFSIAYWGFLGWMPSYLALSRGINLKTLGVVGSIPYACGFVGLLVIGSLGSTMLYRVLPHLTAACFLLSGLGLYIAYASTSLAGSVAGLSIAAACLYGSLSPFGGILLELAPARGRASYSGFVTTFGQLGGVIAPLVIGYLVSATGTFLGGFAFMITAIVVGALCIFALIPSFVARSVAQPVAATSQV